MIMTHIHYTSTYGGVGRGGERGVKQRGKGREIEGAGAEGNEGSKTDSGVGANKGDSERKK